MKVTTAVMVAAFIWLANEYRLYVQHSDMATKSYLEYTRGVGE